MGLFRLMLSDFSNDTSSSDRQEEFRERMAREGERQHAKSLAYENYLYHSNTEEEKAMNRTLWLNL